MHSLLRFITLIVLNQVETPRWESEKNLQNPSGPLLLNEDQEVSLLGTSQSAERY